MIASESEGWGPGVIDANALGVPVRAYRRAGLRGSISDQDTGWLIDDAEPLGPALGDALRELSDADVATSVRVRAQRWIARFTWDEMAKQVMDILSTEEGRLAHSADDRRSHTDLTTVVVVPFALLPENHTLQFRLTDRSLVGADGLMILLRGADTQMALDRVRRAGLSEAAATDPSVQTLVALLCTLGVVGAAVSD